MLRAGGGEMRQPPPVVYQCDRRARQRVPATYVLHGRDEVGFALQGYDRSAGRC